MGNFKKNIQNVLIITIFIKIFGFIYRILCDKIEIVCSGVVILLKKSMRIGEMRVLTAYLRSLFVHHADKVFNALAAYVVCKDICGFTGGAHHQRIQQVPVCDVGLGGQDVRIGNS